MMLLSLLLLQTAIKPLAVGDVAPDVTFSRPDGAALRLSSLRGKIVVLEFTILVCPPCRALAPRLEALAEKEPEVVFLTVCTDAPDAAAELLRERPKGAKTVFVQDVRHDDRSKMAVWKFGNPGFPSLYVIGRDGRMASRLIMGEVDDLVRLKARIAWAKAK